MADKPRREGADERKRESLNREYGEVQKECREIMDSIHLEAEKRTWELCEKLENEGKFPSEQYLFDFQGVKESRKKKPKDFSLRGHVVMFYGFTQYGTPYERLYIKRFKENGEYLPHIVAGKQPIQYHCSLEHDLELLEFGTELETCGRINLAQLNQEWDRRFSEALEIASEISENRRFRALDECDLSDCVNAMLSTALDLSHFDAKEKFCLEFMDESVQERARLESTESYENFLSEMDEKYKLPLGVDSIKSLMELVFNLEGSTTIMRAEGKKIKGAQKRLEFQSNWLNNKREVIKTHFKHQRQQFLASGITSVDYVKLKLDWAEEIGIIVNNRRTGRYSDKYVECFRKLFMLEEQLEKIRHDSEAEMDVGYFSFSDD